MSLKLQLDGEAWSAVLADLAEALASRKAVERAKGILMQKDDIDEAEAFRRIRAASQKTGRTMRVVAEALIATFDEAPE